MNGLVLGLRLGLARPVLCAPGGGDAATWLTDEAGHYLTDEAGNPVRMEES